MTNPLNTLRTLIDEISETPFDKLNALFDRMGKACNEAITEQKGAAAAPVMLAELRNIERHADAMFDRAMGTSAATDAMHLRDAARRGLAAAAKATAP